MHLQHKMPVDFDDPLAGYVVFTRHPTETQVPSAPDSLIEQTDLRERTDRLLREYTPLRPEDDTPTVFRAFLQFLCDEGQTTLRTDMLEVAPDPAKAADAARLSRRCDIEAE